MNGHGERLTLDTKEQAERIASAYTARTQDHTTVMGSGDVGGRPEYHYVIACPSLGHEFLTEDDLIDANLSFDADGNLIDNS